MDYNLAALKLICGQLKDARENPSSSSSSSMTLTLGGIIFQRVWLQGILVSGSKGEAQFLLDDGTGLIKLCLPDGFPATNWKLGMYVMVVGGFVVGKGHDPPLIKVHKMVDLSPFPDREAMWYLEVIEAYKLFYQ